MNKKAQIWVETVIYILIGLGVIAVLLAVIQPRIEQMKDKSVIDSMSEGLSDLDKKINEIKLVSGRKEIIEIGLKKGELVIDPESNSVVFVLDNSKIEYSEIDRKIEKGALTILTQKQRGNINISLSLDYPELYLTYIGAEDSKRFSASNIPYRISIENLGDKEIGIGELKFSVTQIDFSSVS